MGKRGNDVGHELDVQGLGWLDKFGWLRAPEIARLLWPGNEFAGKYAERIARKWDSKGYVIRRKLPSAGGSAFVLAAGGVRFLEENGIAARSGKDWGETDAAKGGAWSPPTTWQHDLRAFGVLSHMHARGHEIMPELQIKRIAPGLAKFPDGLVRLKSGAVGWLEVERAVKSGKALEELAEAMIAVTRGKAPSIGGWKATINLVAFAGDETDTRGYQLDHMSRLKTAIQAQARGDIDVTALTLTMSGFSVAAIAAKSQRISADAVERTLKVMRWIQEKGNAQFAAVGFLHAKISRQDDGKWLAEVSDVTDNRPNWQRTEVLEPEVIATSTWDTITDAKRACASVISHSIE